MEDFNLLLSSFVHFINQAEVREYLFLAFLTVAIIAIVAFCIYKLAVFSLKVVTVGGIIYLLISFVPLNKNSIDDENNKNLDINYKGIRHKVSSFYQKSKPLLNMIINTSNNFD